MASTEPSQLSALLHGTTVATNIVLERNGSRTGMITTAGSGTSSTSAATGARRRSRSIRTSRGGAAAGPARRLPLPCPSGCPPEARCTTPLDEDEVREAAGVAARGEGVEAVAVCFLFSFLNPAHERRVREIVRRSCRMRYVSISQRGQPAAPRVRALLHDGAQRLHRPEDEPLPAPHARPAARRRLHRLPPDAVLGGGVTTVENGRQSPVNLAAVRARSAGIMGGIDAARRSGYDERDHARRGRHLGGHRRGPRRPAADEAPLDTNIGGYDGDGADGRPRHDRRRRRLDRPVDAGRTCSASARRAPAPIPGPVCYGRGGTEPTATDAKVVLGRLRPEALPRRPHAARSDLARARWRPTRRAARPDRSRRPRSA